MSHPDKDIRKAIEYAVSLGWTYSEGGKSHLKGVLLCGGRIHRIPVYGTPRNPTQVAKFIRKDVDKCDCSREDG